MRPRSIAKLVNITPITLWFMVLITSYSWFIIPITMVYGTYNELVTGAFVNQHSHHNGGPHIVSAEVAPATIQGFDANYEPGTPRIFPHGMVGNSWVKKVLVFVVVHRLCPLVI